MKDDVAALRSVVGEPNDFEVWRGRAQSLHRVRIAELAAAFSPRIAGESKEHVSILAELDELLPPIVVHQRTMRVVDGMHRVRAAVLRGDEFIDAVFFDGSESDAFVMAVELNHVHGLPLSTADRTAAAGRIVNSHPEWSDRRIAAVTGLSASTVGSIRARSTERIGRLDSRIGRDGRARPLDSAERRRRAGELISSNPTASLREIAKAAGISSATVSDVRARLARGEPPVTARQQAGEPLDGARVPTNAQSRRSPEPDSVIRGDKPYAQIIGELARDPSLRGNEAGRALLRFLGFAATDQRDRDKIAESIPAHQRNIVARLTKECATLLQGFADKLERSADDT